MDLSRNENLIQNLRDADCSDKFIEEFFNMKNSGNTKQLLQLLYKHKSGLLEKLHNSQRKIDCLDYLIFHINQITDQ